MPYEWTYEADASQQQWLLKRNCALSPRQSALSVALLAAVSLCIAAVFAWLGAWPVVPFAGLEVAALATAFVVYGRHAGDYERIIVSDGTLVVERADGPLVSRSQLRLDRVQVEYRQRDRLGGQDLIQLISGAQVLRVGRFVPCSRRDRLAKELKTSLARRRVAWTADHKAS